jgi:methyl-accepting chemotaxis protein-1 (serine sensor receptor)
MEARTTNFTRVSRKRGSERLTTGAGASAPWLMVTNSFRLCDPVTIFPPLAATMSPPPSEPHRPVPAPLSAAAAAAAAFRPPPVPAPLSAAAAAAADASYLDLHRT